jgi:23S rRNA (pseudouridine1915-N3)-methyltransferase
MKSVLFDFKTAKEEWFEQAVLQYSKKISHYAEFEIHSLKTMKHGRDESDLKKKFEASELFKKIDQHDFVILFDGMGKTMTSEDFAEQITKCEDSGKKRIVYIIGGAYGVTDDVKQRAQVKISLSSMVMNHLVAETMVLEQIYRAYTIKNRIPYHNI